MLPKNAWGIPPHPAPSPESGREGIDVRLRRELSRTLSRTGRVRGARAIFPAKARVAGDGPVMTNSEENHPLFFRKECLYYL